MPYTVVFALVIFPFDILFAEEVNEYQNFAQQIPHKSHGSWKFGNATAEFASLGRQGYLDNSDISDKVMAHGFQNMYGMFTFQLREHAKLYHTKVKIFEIGIGCNSRGTDSPCRSVTLWKNIFGKTLDLWMADVQSVCVATIIASGKHADVHFLSGDQSDESTLKQWIQASNGNFDMIIDDGGHSNHLMIKSFYGLWSEVKPGGYYILEDAHIGRGEPGPKDAGYPPIIELITAWIDELVTYHHKKDIIPPHIKEYREKHPLPKGVKFITCVHEACVFGKCDINDTHCGPQ